MLLTFAYFQVNKVPKCYISSCWSKNVKPKHTYIKSSHDVNHSDESNNIFRGLHSHFFNVAQEFVSDVEEASMLIGCSALLKFPPWVDQAIGGLVQIWTSRLRMPLEEERKTQHQ
ncbi:hypothetical protein PIB30_064946 [Stylosanthes scabra]|uniref:Uncharacterized protein n=1 Tax=Stylosanthes scabra TaxID=79078 RepID=A0ABU6ZKM0_9FABA|nr:hypothetical protein [Stylosanthes scabra]